IRGQIVVQQENEFVYTGPIGDGAKTKPQEPLSAESARVVALSAWNRSGRIWQTPHFRERAKSRVFSILDVHFVIKYGKVVSGPTHCPAYKNHKYYFKCVV